MATEAVAALGYEMADLGLIPQSQALALHHATLGFPDASELDRIRAIGVTQSTLLDVRCDLRTAPVRFLPGGRFEFADDGERAFVLPVYGAGETFLDMVAFVLPGLDQGAGAESLMGWVGAAPLHMARLEGVALFLGEHVLDNPATFFAGQPCRVYRSPLGWLRASGAGVVVLDHANAWWRLIDLPGPLCGEDVEHAKALLRIATPRVCRVLAPKE